jgi:hypothetical protein
MSTLHHRKRLAQRERSGEDKKTFESQPWWRDGAADVPVPDEYRLLRELVLASEEAVGTGRFMKALDEARAYLRLPPRKEKKEK